VADEAFLRRIKYKINIPDPEEAHFRSIFKMVCKGRKVPYEDASIDYLILKWYKPYNRPFRSCQPRDLLDQLISLAKYNLEEATLTPDLLDAACSTYFVGMKEKSGNADFVRPSFG
jgi:SpoVK/Ycf46/Vps4 family AAA+-type ATPase